MIHSTLGKLTTLIVLFIVGFITLNISHGFFINKIESLGNKGENLRNKLRIGEFIVLEMNRMNLEFHKMNNILSSNINATKIQYNNIKKSIGNIEEYLQILQEGGTVVRKMDLNVVKKNRLFEYVTYKKEVGLLLEAIDILPKLKVISSKTENLSVLIEALVTYKEAGLYKEAFEVQNKIGFLYKTTEPDFERLLENTHRLFLDGKQKLSLLEDEIEKQKSYYTDLEYLFSFMTMLIIIVFSSTIAKQIAKTNEKLKSSEKYANTILDSQQEIIILNDGEKISRVNQAFFQFFTQYKSLEEFKKYHDCICEFFVKDLGNDFLIDRLYSGKNWIEHILTHPSKQFKAGMYKDDRLHYFSVSATRISFNEQETAIVSFADITNEIVNQLALRELNITLEYKIKKAIQEEKRAKEEIQKSYDDLKLAQEELIQAEKMASLGGMVAGVAHEINTPVGMALTGITYLEEKTKKLLELYKNEQMSEEDFENYMQTSEKISKSIRLSLEKAANLVRSFKQVAVDQSSEENREFDLKEYMEDILTSLNNEIKKIKHHIIVQIPSPFHIISNPGAISQIITNLLMNSFIHAFEKDEEGTIWIQAKKEENLITITYKDNGRGMDKTTSKKIFEPFFTTNRNNGGSGLGMNIVYNLVTQKLGGTIEFQTAPNEGVTFDITLKANR